jgi:hypothetical protein
MNPEAYIIELERRVAELEEALTRDQWITVVHGDFLTLPKDGQVVLVRRTENNWGMDHEFSHKKFKIWRWVVCVFRVGRVIEDDYEKDHKKKYEYVMNPISFYDQHGNNKYPYGWMSFGSSNLFGQDVSHWMPFEPPDGCGDV